MEHTVAVLTSFPPEGDSAPSNKQYDLAIKSYLGALGKLSEAARPAISANPAQVLQVLDPAVNSIGYLAVLDILHAASAAERVAVREELLDRTLEFLLQFDPYQIRYVGASFRGLLERVGHGRLFSPLVAVELLAHVILRLDPSGSLFTSTHLLLVKLAFDTNNIEPALAVIDRDVVFYPNMAGPKETRPLCDKALEAAAYLTAATELTGPVKPAQVLEYNLLCGMIYMSRRDWGKAQTALERVISHPAKEKAVAKIMVEAYKKWLLVGLLHRGETPALPSYTASMAKMTYTTLSAPYSSLAALFNTDRAPQIKTEVATNSQAWEDDGNTSLMTEVVGAYQKWQIINLRRVYQNVPLSTVQSATLSAETGEPLQDVEAVTDLIRGMIESGMLKGDLAAGVNGQESYLTFHDDQTLMSEADFAKQIAQSHHSIVVLGKQYQLTNDRLSHSKEYVRYLSKEQRRLEKDDGEAVAPFDAHVEDEDLMTGIVTHT